MIARIRAQLPSLLASWPGIELVYLFGSHAAGATHPESDVDLAVLSRHPIGAMARFELAQALAGRLGREVDLVDLSSASTVLRKEVVAHGRLLHASAPRARADFEWRALADYARLNEERRPILERVAREGRVHD
ncbi:MAG: nucleotidyltransferase domain-containing protein [Deltaproteobacteria bacterium]|nr:nucleotidyltransferase domain-containing protein [Deltaproteobacteria bacterium]